MIRCCVAYDQREYRLLAQEFGWKTQGVGRVILVTTQRDRVGDVVRGTKFEVDEIFWSDRCYDGPGFASVESLVLSRVK